VLTCSVRPPRGLAVDSGTPRKTLVPGGLA
jgi:hypothetical protein